MKVEWNNCFTCLNALSPGNERDRLKRVNLKLPFKYLLDTKNQTYDHVLEDTLKCFEGGSKRATRSPRMHLCDKCEAVVVKIGYLHQQLEVVQMKLTAEINNLKGVIIGSSKMYGDNELTKACFQSFEDWLNEQEMAGMTQSEERQILDVLYAFQTGVYEKDKQDVSPQVPLVYLRNYIHASAVKKSATPIVKSEPGDSREPVALDDPVFYPTFETEVDEMDVFPVSLSVPAFNENIKLENAKSPSTERKLRTRKTIKLSDPDYSEEFDDLKKHKVKRTKNTKANKKRPILSQGALKPTKSLKSKSGKLKIDKKLTKQKQSYVCESCPYTTKNSFKFEYHLRDHETSEGNYRCDKCDVKFSGQQFFAFHMARHGKKDRIICDVCRKVFDPYVIEEHLKTHSEKVFCCSYCSFCCLSREKFLEHLKLHNRALPFSCDICGHICKGRQKLLKHLYEAHKAIEMLKCGAAGCDKMYLDPYSLWMHKKIHSQQHLCVDCNKAFSTTGALSAHRRHHTGEKPYPCDMCSETFNSKFNLQRHQINHHNAPKFKCHYCDKEYSDRPTLNTHLNIHEGTGIPCGICDKSFGNRYLWQRHQVTHSSKKDFVCDECGKAFSRQQALKRHKAIHVGDKKFQCPHCPKAFIFEKYLRTHVRIHTGEKPYVCDTCGKDFNQYPALFVHKKKHIVSAPSTLPVPTATGMSFLAEFS